jgi:hypothetical protein
LTLAVAGVTVAGCTTSRTHLLPSYVLDNGQRLQDVVTVAGDSTGDAPSLTVVKTYDVSSAGQTVLVSHDTASAPSVGTVIAGGIAGAIPHAAAAVGIAAIHNKRRPVVSANITTNVANANENNSAASSDNNNAVDVANVASADNNNAVDVANAAISDAISVSLSENNNVVAPDIINVAALSSDNNSVIAPEMTNIAASQSTSDNNSINNNDATAVNANTNENVNVNANFNELNTP